MSEHTWEGEDRRKREPWHVARDIPISLLLALALQTGGGIWWASNLTTKIDTALSTLAEFKAERYTAADARRDRDLHLTMLDGLRARDADIERRIVSLERQHEQIMASLSKLVGTK